MTGQLEHPGIVPVYELGLDDDSQPFYTMKYIRGQTLHDILKRIAEGDAATLATFSLNRLLAIFLKACDAIAFAHSRQVIHRDLKPANLMIGDFGEVLVVDWGLAKVIDPSTVCQAISGEDEIPDWVIESIRDSESGSAIRTAAGQLMGTPAFMAPEQAHGNPDVLDGRTDVYALGAILYMILALEKPVSGKTMHALLLNVVNGRVTPLENYNDLPHCPGGTIPRSLAAVAKKAMHVQPEKRYANAQELQADVQAYLDGFATEAEKASLWQLARLCAARNKGIVIVCAIFALLALGFVGQIIVSERKAQANAVLAEQHAAESAENAKRATSALDELRGAVPTFVTYAQSQVKEHAFEDAVATLQYALTLDPAHSLALELKANVLQALGHFEESTAAYHALSGTQAAHNIALNTKLAGMGSDNDRLLHLQADLLAQERLYEAGFVGSQLTLSSDAALQIWRPVFEASGLQGKLQPGRGDRINVYLTGDSLVGSEHLRGMPINLLRLEIRGLQHLAPLKGLDFRELFVEGSKITTLEPLRDMQLTALTVMYLEELSLEPLRGMPLAYLDLHGCEVRDPSPLAGMALRELRLRVRKQPNPLDISVIGGMPL